MTEEQMMRNVLPWFNRILGGKGNMQELRLELYAMQEEVESHVELIIRSTGQGGLGDMLLDSREGP